MDSGLATALPSSRRRALLRPLIWLAELFAFVAVIGGLAFGLLSWRLSVGPVSFDGLNGLVVELMSRQLSQGFVVEAGQARIVKQLQGIGLEVETIRIRDQKGLEVLAIPQAVLTFDGQSLLRFDPKPSTVEFVGLSLTLTISKEGGVALNIAPNQEGESKAAPSPAVQSSSNELEAGPLRIASIIDALFSDQTVLSILQRARLRDGQLLIDDQRNDRRWLYSKAMLNLLRVPGQALDLSISAEGPSGRWSVAGSLSGESDKARTMRIKADNLAISDLLGLASKGVLPVTTDMPLSFETSLTIEPDGNLVSLEGQITGGKAIVRFDMAGAEPITISSLSGRFQLTDQGQTIRFSDLALLGRAMQWQGQGQLQIPQQRADPWRFALSGSDSKLALDRLEANPLSITAWALSGEITQGFRGLTVEKLQFDGPDVMIGLKGRFGQFADYSGVDFTVHGERMQARGALAFWPLFVVPDTRAYLIRRLESGVLDVLDFRMAMNNEQLVAVFAEQPVPDDSLRLDARMSGAVMQPDEGLPKLRDLNGTVQVTGTTAKVAISQGQAIIGERRLAMSEGLYAVHDTTQNPAIAAIGFKLKGPAAALFEALQMPALRGITPPKVTADQVRGQVDLTTSIQLPIVPDSSTRSIKTEAQGRFSNLVIDKIFGKEKLENGALQFTYGQDGLSLKGEARLGGAASHILYQQGPNDKEPLIQLAMQIDEAARQKLGFKGGNQVQGTIAAKILINPQATKPGAQVELDLAKASINGLLPGWVKPQGRAGKWTFRLITNADETSSLKDMVLDGGAPVFVRGDVDLGADGTIQSATLPQVKLSANDDMKVDMERAGSVLKIQIRAGVMDAKPLLKQEFSATGSGHSSSGDVEIDLKAGSLAGYSGQIMQNVDLKLVNRGGDIRDFRLAGKFSGKSVVGQMGRSESGAPAMLVESADAGDFLRFLDLYRRMQGGRLVLQVATTGEPKGGLIIINDFALKDDPALSGALKVQPIPGNGPATPESNVVNFSKLRAQYTLGGGKFIVQDAVMWGTTLGGTLEGTLDYATDKADMTGTFVPLYGLNNMLTQIPLFGPLLMGGSNSGIFAINFRISGSVSNPTVTINPLSAVAPGIFRKLFLFGVGKVPETDQAPPAGKPPADIPNPKAQ